MAEKTCTAQDNADSHQAVAPGKFYGPAWVDILDVDAQAKTVKFRTAQRGTNEPVEVKCEWTRQNVWARCPSTLDCDEQRLPTIGSSGKLYLSRSLVDIHQLDVDVKWPNALAGAPPEYRPLSIWPLSLQLRGIELATGTMTSATIDLMDPNLVGPGQTFTLEDKPLTVNVSQRGSFRFFAPWATLQALRIAKEMIIGERPASARDKARAWAQVAAWDDRLGGCDGPDSDQVAAARQLIVELTH